MVNQSHGWPIQGECQRCHTQGWVWQDEYCSARCRWLDSKGNRNDKSTRQCEICGKLLRKPSRGPIPRVCGTKCRQTKYRRQKAHAENQRDQAARDAAVDMSLVCADFAHRARMISQASDTMSKEITLLRAQSVETMKDMLAELARLESNTISQSTEHGLVSRLCEQIDMIGVSGDAARLLKNTTANIALPEHMKNTGE